MATHNDNSRPKYGREADWRSEQPCKYIDTPEGCYRKDCPWSHDSKVSRSANTTPLESTQNGIRNQSSEAPYRQSSGSASRNDRNGYPRDPPPRTDDPQEAQVRRWRYLTLDGSQPDRPLPRHGRNKFFQDALKLVQSDAGSMQAVIQALASDGGLKRIRQLVTQDFQTLPVDVLTELLPFLQVISYPKVLSSGLLESSRETIYNAIYGPGGQHALKLFEYVASTVEQLSTSDLEAIVAVYAKTLELNGSSGLVVGFRPVVEKLSAAVEAVRHDCGDLSVINARRWLERAKLRLGLGEPITRLANETNRSSRPRYEFAFQPDLPGHLSRTGPRHDNDFEDIRDIQILPTFEEIMCDRNSYLPVLNPVEHHLSGTEGLIDRHFRLYREDVVGSIRDAVKFELDRPNHPNARSNGLRTYTYTNLVFEHLHCHQTHGLVVTISIDQPHHLATASPKQRNEWYENRKRLQKDSMVCIIDAAMKHTIFCTVSEIRGKAGLTSEDDEGHPGQGSVIKFQDLGSNEKRAIITVTLAEEKDVPRIVDYFLYRKPSWNLTLLEFPKVLLQAFRPTLAALQRMISDQNLPFADLLVGPRLEAEQVNMGPPPYAQQRNFRFDLRCLLSDSDSLTNSRLGLDEDFDIKEFINKSSLDEKQAEALVHALSHRLALCQGPPGTGKSYTGIALTRALLANKKTADLGPILVVCYTNHALDQILEHFLDNGITRVIRMGGRSKSELLGNLNLRVVSQQMERTRTEKKVYFDRTKILKADASYVNQVIADLRRPNIADNIKSYLDCMYPNYYNSFWGLDADGFQVYSFSSDYVIRSWLSGSVAPLPGVVQTTRTVEELLEAETDVYAMSNTERQAVFTFWADECQQSRTQKFLSALSEYWKTKDAHDDARQEIDQRCLEQANIIGITTSGLARNLNLLKRLPTKVLLVEEAGEVLEAHILTALLPSLEHAILIGDHQQLRPQVTNFDLTSENPRGKKYSLDISLFERLVSPPIGAPGIKLPFSTLNIQRRMHPSISALIKRTLYPNLEDAPNVLTYPVVTGMKKRLFWLDHTWPEAGAETDELTATSKSNDYEVEMTACVVAHLLSQGEYQSQEIAVLTPYLGQLFKLRARLSNQFEILMDDRDADALEKAGVGEEGGWHPPVKVAQKASLLRTLKVATVDNFQGEEAKIVIVSLVRSNKENNCGFLKTHNRINVLLSRAMHGMYLIGNAKTSGGVSMWAKVLNILREGDNVGKGLALCCPRHPWTQIEVSEPEDFQRFSPEGGCNLRCDRQLTCGHMCVTKCHSDLRHGNVHCLEPCERLKPGCDHACKKHCGDKCDPRCEEILLDVNLVLRCGHVIKDIQCWQYQTQNDIKCAVMVEREAPVCGHTVNVSCYVDVEDEFFKCQSTCAGELECGHTCDLQCYFCNSKYGDSHGNCTKKCDRPFPDCNHNCLARCHPDKPCGICRRFCEVTCSHSRCDLLCGEPCTPCDKKDCSSACPHSKCSMPCAAPCDWKPCGKRCRKDLQCGHQCPSLCGEICPDVSYCQECGSDLIKSLVVDTTANTRYSEAVLDKNPLVVPHCGHAILMKSMDEKLDMSSVYDMDPNGIVKGIKTMEPFSSTEMKGLSSCPTCWGTLRGINRYGRLVRRVLLDESTKRFVTSAGTAFGPLTEQLYTAQEKLTDAPVIPTDLDLASDLIFQDGRDAQFQRIATITSGSIRYEDLKKVRRNIANYFAKVHQEETPFARLWKNVETTRIKAENVVQRHNPDAVIKSPSPVAQVSFHLMALALLVRCDLLLLADVLTEFEKFRGGRHEFVIRVNLEMNRKDCLWLSTEARKAKDFERAVEAHIFYARYCAIERSFATSPETASALKSDGARHVVAARMLCEQYSGRLSSLIEEVRGAEQSLLHDDFIQVKCSKERRAILSAVGKQFRAMGQGQWCTCVHGHPFTVKEEEQMELARCPQCDATVTGYGQATSSLNGTRDL